MNAKDQIAALEEQIIELERQKAVLDRLDNIVQDLRKEGEFKELYIIHKTILAQKYGYLVKLMQLMRSS